jgi:hypothetical protein
MSKLLNVNFVKVENDMFHYTYEYEDNQKVYTLNFSINKELSNEEMFQQAEEAMEYISSYGISDFY